MSPILNATEIENENELTEEAEAATDDAENTEAADAADVANVAEQPDPAFPVRSFTLPMPPECQTAVVLLSRQTAFNTFNFGFHVTRAIDVSPYEPYGERIPGTEDDSEESFPSLGDAIEAAAVEAKEWLSHNSDDQDTEAEDFLNQWWMDFNPDDFTEAMLDPLEEIVTDKPDSEPCPDCAAAEPVAVDVVVPVQPTGVTDGAQKHFDDRKHLLEESIGKLSIEQVRLKAAVKCNREAMNTVTEELESHICCGPERLPLFDRQPSYAKRTAAKAADEHDLDNCTCAGCAKARVETADAKESAAADAPAATDSETWRAVTIEELGIQDSICKLLREENGMTTLGQIADHGKEYDLTDLKKIGKAKAEKIQDAMEDYWAKNPPAAAE